MDRKQIEAVAGMEQQGVTSRGNLDTSGEYFEASDVQPLEYPAAEPPRSVDALVKKMLGAMFGAGLSQIQGMTAVLNVVLADKGLVRIEDVKKVVRQAWGSSTPLFESYLQFAPKPERTPQERMMAGPPDKDGRRCTADWTLVDERGEHHVIEYHREPAEIVAALKERGDKAK